MERIYSSLVRLTLVSLLFVIVLLFLLRYVYGAVSFSQTHHKKVLAQKVVKPTETPTPIPTTTPLPTATPTPTSIPTPMPTANPTSDNVWDSLSQCESHGNWTDDTGNGYFGGLQFSQGAWESVGGTGKPSNASREEQISRGKMLQARRGWAPWGACSRGLGLY